jgi:hypothetical protein
MGSIQQDAWFSDTLVRKYPFYYFSVGKGIRLAAKWYGHKILTAALVSHLFYTGFFFRRTKPTDARSREYTGVPRQV